MTDREVIIDGVNVAGCEHCTRVCQNTKEPQAICELYRYCTNNPNCIYKQSQRLQAENEELKNNYDAIKQCNKNNMQTLDETIKEKRKAEQKLEKVEKQYKCYSCGTCNGKEDYYNLAGHYENAIKSLHKAQNKSDRYKQALNKIKNILEVYFDDDWKATREIERIISEVKQ